MEINKLKNANNEKQPKTITQTSYLVAVAGSIGTAMASPFAVVGYTLSNMAASNSSFKQIKHAIKNNPYLLFSSTKNVTVKLSLSSIRSLVVPYANQTTQLLSPSQQDLAIAAMMSIAELPSAVAELFEINKSSRKTYHQILTTSGKRVADNARLLVNLKAPSTWTLFFACTMIKNYPLNYVGARSTRIANEANEPDQQKKNLKIIIL